MNPASPAVSPAPPPDITQEVVIPGNDGLALHGTLQRPPAAAAVLLLQGSGPVDRDGNVPNVLETDLERQIAQALARAGIASLRYDKRGEYANKAELPADMNAIEAFLDWNNLVGDAAAAWRFLREQPGIARQRVAVFGHSEGGIRALAAARQLLDAGEGPAALILAATPGRPMGEVLHQQIERVIKQRGVDPDAATRLLKTLDEIQREIVQTGAVPETVPPELKAIYRPELAAYWRALLPLHPAELARRYPGPVLIVEGTADTQVSVRDDALKLDAALSARPTDDHDLLLAPRVSHELKPIGAPPDAVASEAIKPGLVDGIIAWVKKKLVVP